MVTPPWRRNHGDTLSVQRDTRFSPELITESVRSDIPFPYPRHATFLVNFCRRKCRRDAMKRICTIDESSQSDNDYVEAIGSRNSFLPHKECIHPCPIADQDNCHFDLIHPRTMGVMTTLVVDQVSRSRLRNEAGSTSTGHNDVRALCANRTTLPRRSLAQCLCQVPQGEARRARSAEESTSVLLVSEIRKPRDPYPRGSNRSAVELSHWERGFPRADPCVQPNCSLEGTSLPHIVLLNHDSQSRVPMPPPQPASAARPGPLRPSSLNTGTLFPSHHPPPTPHTPIPPPCTPPCRPLTPPPPPCRPSHHTTPSFRLVTLRLPCRFSHPTVPSAHPVTPFRGSPLVQLHLPPPALLPRNKDDEPLHQVRLNETFTTAIYQIALVLLSCSY